MSRGNSDKSLINSLSIIFLCFCSDGRQVRLVSFFVSSLFVPDAERAIVLAWRGISGLQDVFMEEEFDMTLICTITEEDLEKLGIKMGQRRKFQAAQKADCTQLE